MLTDLELRHLGRAIALAQSARERGNHPFGAIAIGADGNILGEAENTVVSTQDCTGHAELNLVRHLSASYEQPTLARSTLYTSTEPCAMCAGAICWSGIGRVVFALSEEGLYALMSPDKAAEAVRIPCRELFARCGRTVAVEGPALEEEAVRVHEGFWTASS
jgi:tRNA(Arg) A34 adenosine deaminase TadA